jgi:anaerobic selenocysteine-containing dehydrogenase
MSEKLTRRNFLKLTGLGIAATAVLTGCGPASRYVLRRPYTEMPEYSQIGKSTYYATACRECPAGCGMIMRTFEGRAIKAEGNPAHPVNRGKLCSRGLTAVQGLYNPDRYKAPVRRSRRGDARTEALSWDEAIEIVRSALNGDPERVAFYLGLNTDHVFDFVEELTRVKGMPAPVRFGALGMFEARATLVEAARQVFGKATLPFFDLAGADLVLSFGANFLETWLSPVAYSRAFGDFRRRGEPLKKRGYLVALEPRLSLTAGSADEWYPLTPGTEGAVAMALGKLLVESGAVRMPETLENNYRGVNVEAVAQAAGIPQEKLEHLAQLIARAERPLFLPGGGALGHASGLENALQIFALNVALGRVGQPGGVFLIAGEERADSLEAVQTLIQRMQAGEVDTLFIHGANPLFELPKSLGFEQALSKVRQVISFATFPDETSLFADYVFPDHSPLEGFGYVRVLAGTPRFAISAAQPVVVPLYDTRATVDVLIAASGLPYTDEVDFIQQKLQPVFQRSGAPELATFWARFLQQGGYWEDVGESPVSADLSTIPAKVLLPESAGEKTFHLVVYPTQMGDGSGANRPWLQETPDPMTTVMWNTWVEINPQTAEELGIHNDDIVRLVSSAGQIEAVAYLYPAIRPDTVAIPFGQGHTALGRFAEGRGVNPAEVIQSLTNTAGDLAVSDTKVRLEPTGKRRPLSRLESKSGVYGEH